MRKIDIIRDVAWVATWAIGGYYLLYVIATIG